MNVLKEFREKSLEWRFCQDMSESQRSLYFLLRDAIKNNENRVMRSRRNSGKSFIIGKLSEEFGLPVLVPSIRSKTLKEKDNPKGRYISPYDSSLVGRSAGIILCDDFIAIEQSPHIPVGQKFVGFY